MTKAARFDELTPVRARTPRGARILNAGRLVCAVLLLTLLAALELRAQQTRTVTDEEWVPHGDYILQSGIPSCGAGNNPLDAIQAAATVIAGAYKGGV
jgi:hypothetical protein